VPSAHAVVMEPALVVRHKRVLPELDGGTESNVQVISRLHTNPPFEPFTHCHQEGVQSVHPAVRSVKEDFSRVAVALVRPTDWYQI